MPRRVLIVLIGVVSTLAIAGVTFAHHTFVTKYDPARLIRLSGVVGAVTYANPHIFFEFAASGGTWTVETEGIPAARNRGLTEAHLKEGAKATLSGWAARDKSGAIGLQTITFVGGPSITMRSTAR